MSIQPAATSPNLEEAESNMWSTKASKNEYYYDGDEYYNDGDDLDKYIFGPTAATGNSVRGPEGRTAAAEIVPHLEYLNEALKIKSLLGEVKQQRRRSSSSNRLEAARIGGGPGDGILKQRRLLGQRKIGGGGPCTGLRWRSLCQSRWSPGRRLSADQAIFRVR
jgi:hypothetical protein